MKIYAFMLALVVFGSCNKENKEVNSRTNQIERMELLKKDAIQNGNDFAYGSYLEYADNNRMNYEKLSISLLMNQRHQNLRSYYQIYRNLIELHNDNEYNAKFFGTMDSVDRNYAFAYLKEGAKRNFISCQVSLEQIYRNGYGVEKNLKKSDSLYSILEKNPARARFYKENRNNKSKVNNID